MNEYTNAALTLATTHGFAQLKSDNLTFTFKGYMLATQGQRDGWTEGISLMRQGIRDTQRAGRKLGLWHLRALLAEQLAEGGQAQEGLYLIAETLHEIGDTQANLYAAELHRLKGDFLLRQSVPDQQHAEAYLQKALIIARHQDAKSWELRAAVSLSRLWQQQGKQDAARQLLAEIYNWFTEGLGTADLQEAKALLHELA